MLLMSTREAAIQKWVELREGDAPIVGTCSCGAPMVCGYIDRAAVSYMCSEQFAHFCLNPNHNSVRLSEEYESQDGIEALCPLCHHDATEEFNEVRPHLDDIPDAIIRKVAYDRWCRMSKRPESAMDDWLFAESIVQRSSCHWCDGDSYRIDLRETSAVEFGVHVTHRRDRYWCADCQIQWTQRLTRKSPSTPTTRHSI